MRSLVVSIAIGIIMVAGSIFYTQHLENLSEQMLEINESIGRSIHENNFESASIKTEELHKLMDGKRMVMEATGNHEELDEIEMNLFELESYIDAKNSADAAAKCNVLEFLIEHLPKNFKLKIENIL